MEKKGYSLVIEAKDGSSMRNISQSQHIHQGIHWALLINIIYQHWRWFLYSIVVFFLFALFFSFEKHTSTASRTAVWTVRIGIVLSALLFLIFEALPTIFREIRAYKLREWGIKGKLSEKSYFRIGPYNSTETDRKAYYRLDDLHKRITSWIGESKSALLYLTGVSGTGKTSLISAYSTQYLKTDYKTNTLIFRGVRVIFGSELQIQNYFSVDDASLNNNIKILIERAAALCEPARLLLIFDQFEELLINPIQRDSELRRVFELIKQLIDNSSTTNIRILLIVRSDYVGELQQQILENRLPLLRMNENWAELPPLRESDARTMLVDSGLVLGNRLLESVFEQIAAIEDTPGLVRPITINMVGCILARRATIVPKLLKSGKVTNRILDEYIESCLLRVLVREHSVNILQHMTTSVGTKFPVTCSTLSEYTKIPKEVIVGVLLAMAQDGIVRPIGGDNTTWEISHDFVARLINRAIIKLRNSVHSNLLHMARFLWIPIVAIAMVVYFFSSSAWYIECLIEEKANLQSGHNCLHKAAEKKDGAEAVAYLHAHNVQFISDDDGDTPIHIAAQQGNTGPLRSLLKFWPKEIDSRDGEGNTALNLAAHNGHKAAVALLVEYGANIKNKDKDGSTPLHDAAAEGYPEIVELLLKKQSDIINLRDGDFFTPLHRAARGNHASVIRALIDLNVDTSARDNLGRTALHYAAGENHPDAVKELAKNGALINEQDARFGRTALAYAAYYGNTEIATDLLRLGANIRIRDSEGKTPLMLAVENNRIDILDLLISKADQLTEPNGDGELPIHRAAASCNLQILEKILFKGAFVDSRTRAQSWTPLHYASYFGCTDTILPLLKAGADPNAQSRNVRETPLHRAVMRNRTSVLKILLDNHADPLLKDQDGETALFWATNKDYQESVEIFIAHDPSLCNVTRNDGRIPLHEAAVRGYDNLITALMKCSKQIDLKDKNGKTPVDLAREANQVKILPLLRNKE